MDLPPGFRFHPTDEELITHYLSRKAAGKSLSPEVIEELDMNRREPWDLPSRSKLGEEWYFFCVRDRKYPTGLRTNRATESGYWKATGKDKEIHRRKVTVGMKKTLVFYKGRAPKGEKTNWIMHEYRLEGKRSKDNDWVMCRVFYRSCSGQKDMALIKMRSWQEEEISSSSAVPLVDDHYSSKDSSVSNEKIHVTCFSNPLEGQKCYDELLANSYNSSSFLSNERVSWSSLISSPKTSQKSFMRQAPVDLETLQHQVVGTISSAIDYNSTVMKRKERIGASEELLASSNLQYGTSSAAVISNDADGCLLNYQNTFPLSSQFLHLDAWPLSQ